MTTPDYTLLAVEDLRTYLWDKIQGAGLLDPQDYFADGFDQPLIPIIPSQQVPEFNNSLKGKTHIVYDYETLPSKPDWWTKYEVMTLMINSRHHDEINTLMNFIVDLFQRYDESAADILGDSAILSKNFMFKFTTVQKVVAPTPQKNEGGLQTGLINVFYSYVRVLQPNNRF